MSIPFYGVAQKWYDATAKELQEQLDKVAEQYEQETWSDMKHYRHMYMVVLAGLLSQKEYEESCTVTESLLSKEECLKIYNERQKVW